LKRFFSVLLLISTMVSCSEDSTGPEEGDNDNQSGQFQTSYSAEDVLAESASVDETGGIVTATSSDDVVFTLRIPAGALESDTLITVTPVSGLAVSGPGAFTYSSRCPATDSCVAGALFEPAGLEFDSLVTIEISFPSAGDFPFDSTAAVFMFDSPHSDMGACETTIDLPGKTLIAKVWHFTGYGTAAADCDRLSAMYSDFRVSALSFAGTELFFNFLYDLVGIMSFNITYDQSGSRTDEELCDGLSDLVYTAANEAVRAHSSALLALYPSSPGSRDNIEELIGHLGRSVYFAGYDQLSYDIGQFREALLGRILEIAQSLAADANSLCSSGQCEDGQNLLYYIEGLGTRGYITDATFLANVEDWIEDCCGGWELTLSVDKPEILRCIINSGDEQMCVATVTATVKSASGEPIEGAFICMDMEGNNQALPGGESDANGEHKCSFSSYDLGYGDDFNCSEMIQREITADVLDTDNSERIYAGPLIMTFRNFAVSTEVDYTYSAEEYEDSDNYGSSTGSITGTGTSYASKISYCQPSCTDVFTRAYYGSGCINGDCGETYIVDGAEANGCIIKPDLDYIENPEGVRIPVLLGLNFLPYEIVRDVKIFTCSGTDSTEFWTWLGSWVEWPGYNGIPEYFEIDEGGNIEPFTWTFEEISDTSTKNASLRITLEASH